MKWATVKFLELFRVKHGYASKSSFFDSAGPYVLLTPGSFNEKGGYRDQGEKTKFYTGDIPNGFILNEGDLLVAMTEQAPGLLGSSAWIPESNRFLHNQRLGRVADIDERRIDKRFLCFRQRLEPQLRPVLRETDFGEFDLERAFGRVRAMAAALNLATPAARVK